MWFLLHCLAYSRGKIIYNYSLPLALVVYVHQWRTPYMWPLPVNRGLLQSLGPPCKTLNLRATWRNLKERRRGKERKRKKEGKKERGKPRGEHLRTRTGDHLFDIPPSHRSL
jgi:hypothetical protein